jgi:asparagine synthase (glutamine-hydrolysing)
MSFWEPRQTNVIYHKPSFSYPLQYKKEDYSENLKYYCSTIQQILINAVNKRCLTTERPLACLLSGGLDSSLITALVNEFQKQHVSNKPLDSGFNKPLETYSIGLEGSIDLIYARKMADYLNTNHTEIIVTEQEMFDAIPEVIQAIESYDTTTVRASIGNYLLGKYIAKHSEAKVIFNGDGSDEVCGGYLYLKQCPDAIEFDQESRRLLKDIHLFDVLRSDKSISSHGLEPRTPFLDRSFVNHYLSIPPEFRFQTNQKRLEKYLLRESFSYDFFVNSESYQLLPDEILWRRKEAFSDGVSSQGRSLFQILQEKSANELNKRNDYFNKGKVYEASLETEKYYYKSIFNKFYALQESILPYFWMPKYTDAKDPSARTLDIYQKDDKE